MSNTLAERIAEYLATIYTMDCADCGRLMLSETWDVAEDAALAHCLRTGHVNVTIGRD